MFPLDVYLRNQIPRPNAGNSEKISPKPSLEKRKACDVHTSRPPGQKVGSLDNTLPRRVTIGAQGRYSRVDKAYMIIN